MELGVLERVLILSLLPLKVEEDYIRYKVITDLKRELSFSEDELKEFNIISEGDKIKWDVSKERKKDVNIGDVAREVITEAFESLSKQKKINDQNVSLYEEFVIKK